ncbi:hypothetical protein SCAZ3_08325 [Streptococcus canis FSL Z3-227]|uniref:Transposase n=1 Tax=Streptococcus canis FSL Z3-227 TaxID=482234 RepID=A0AAV3FVA0_STRCB|nr:hypothetical protein SCAZ3_08325 [Streptococcus canis FSL Z3-227]
MSLIENLVEQHSLKYPVFQLLTAFIKQYDSLLDKIAQQRGKPIESYVKKPIRPILKGWLIRKVERFIF